MTKIIFVDSGVANRIGDEILINKKIKDEPELLAWILDHEKQHTGEFTIKDLQHDYNLKLENIKMSWRLLKWQITHPSTYTQVLPAMWYKGELYWDVSVIIAWIIGISLLVAFFYFI